MQHSRAMNIFTMAKIASVDQLLRDASAYSVGGVVGKPLVCEMNPRTKRGKIWPTSLCMLIQLDPLEVQIAEGLNRESMSERICGVELKLEK